MTLREVLKFRLYVADDTANSTQARVNLEAFCRTHLEDRNEIEVIDVLQHPKRALADAISMTPTLVKWDPLPAASIRGTLGDEGALLLALGLAQGAP
jgi:circadian clock protein KaiB